MTEEYREKDIRGEISERIRRMPASATMAANAEATAFANKLKEWGIDKEVEKLTLGQPDTDPASTIKTMAKYAAEHGLDERNRYTPSAGDADVLKMLADEINRHRDTGITKDNLAITNGGKFAVSSVIEMFVDPDDNVVMADNSWVTYNDNVLRNGGTVTRAETEGKGIISPEELYKSIDEDTTLVILNDPSNPSGYAGTPEEREEKFKIIYEERQRRAGLQAQGFDIKQIRVMQDDIYEHTRHDGPVAKAGEWEKKLKDDMGLVIVNGNAKGEAMMNSRIGWIDAHKDIVDIFKSKILGGSSSAIAFASQVQILDAINHVREQTDFYDKNRESLVEKKQMFVPEMMEMADGKFKINGLPDAGFYAFANVEGFYGMGAENTIKDANGIEMKVTLSEDGELKRDTKDSITLPKEGIQSADDLRKYLLYVGYTATVAQDNDFMRFSYATDEKNIRQSLDNIELATSQLKQRQPSNNIETDSEEITGNSQQRGL